MNEVSGERDRQGDCTKIPRIISISKNFLNFMAGAIFPISLLLQRRWTWVSFLKLFFISVLYCNIFFDECVHLNILFFRKIFFFSRKVVAFRTIDRIDTFCRYKDISHNAKRMLNE